MRITLPDQTENFMLTSSSIYLILLYHFAEMKEYNFLA